MRLTHRTMIAAAACCLFASAAAASPRILVVSRSEGALQAFDARTYQPLFSVKVPGEPHQVVLSPDGRFAYTTDYPGLDNTVSIIDLEKHERVAFVNMKPSYKPHGLAINKDGSHLYVTCEASRAVVDLNLETRKIARTFKLRDDGVHLLALSPDQKWVYATSQWNGTVSFINVASGELVRTVLSGNGCEGLAVTPDGSEIWAVNRLVQNIAVINTAEHKRDAVIPAVGNPLRVRFTADGSTAIVTCALTNQLALFDHEKREETGRVLVGNFPIEVEIAPDGKLWYVTNGNASTVSVVDAVTHEQVTTFPVGEAPEGIVYVK